MAFKQCIACLFYSVFDKVVYQSLVASRESAFRFCAKMIFQRKNPTQTTRTMASLSPELPPEARTKTQTLLRLQTQQETINETQDKVAKTNSADSPRTDDVKKQLRLPNSLQQLAPMDAFI